MSAAGGSSTAQGAGSVKVYSKPRQRQLEIRMLLFPDLADRDSR
ncbi:hypothetical protein ACIRRA_42920 [Nocardia sp. NPDC101769]